MAGLTMKNILLLTAFATVTSTALAVDTCMVSPTDKEVVSGRFGKFRNGGAANHGSSNQRPHMHDGLDFSTSNANQPLYATTEGEVIWAEARGSAGNTVMIKRPTGDIVAYYHLNGFATGLKVGAKVTPGQQIGISGNTNSGGASVGKMDKHLHFVYGTSKKDDARAKAFPDNAGRGPFNPVQLPSAFNQQNGIGWKTDPAPFFCKTYAIQDGHPEHLPILGKDTKEQYAILFGSVPASGTPPNVKFESSQVAAANSDVALANAAGTTPVAMLKDSDGYGALPTAPIGGYDTMSTSEMMLTEATRRFSDANWNTNITKVSSRALWVDYNRAIGVGNYLAEATYRKKEKVEALLALYTSLKMKGIRLKTDASRERAQRNDVARSIN
jgi:murein DD-endopeptidase